MNNPQCIIIKGIVENLNYEGCFNVKNEANNLPSDNFCCQLCREIPFECQRIDFTRYEYTEGIYNYLLENVKPNSFIRVIKYKEKEANNFVGHIYVIDNTSKKRPIGITLDGKVRERNKEILGKYYSHILIWWPWFLQLEVEIIS